MAKKEMAFLNIGEDEFEVVDAEVREIAETGQFDTVPTDGAIYYTGTGIPDGYEETIPPSGQGAEIDDTAPSLNKVYSSAKVEDLISGISGGLDYSTEEQDTGLKWIDGSPIYQKSFTGVALTVAHTIMDATGIIPIRCDGWIRRSSNNMGVSLGGITNSTTWTLALHIDSNNNLCVMAGNDTIGCTYYVTVYYIKETTTE